MGACTSGDLLATLGAVEQGLSNAAKPTRERSGGGAGSIGLKLSRAISPCSCICPSYGIRDLADLFSPGKTKT